MSVSWWWKKKKKKVEPGKTEFELPIRIVRDVPLIQLELNGKKAIFLVDTGASLNLLNPRYARKYGFKTFKLRDQSIVTGIGGSSEQRGISKAKITIEGKDWKIPFRGLKLSHIDLPIVGLIGSKTLRDHRLIIDYDLKKIIKK